MAPRSFRRTGPKYPRVVRERGSGPGAGVDKLGQSPSLGQGHQHADQQGAGRQSPGAGAVGQTGFEDLGHTRGVEHGLGPGQGAVQLAPPSRL